VEALVNMCVDANVADVLLGQSGGVGVGTRGPVSGDGRVGSGKETEIGDDPGDTDDIVVDVVLELHLELVACGEDEVGYDEYAEVVHVDGVC
jgi:hypothetical protein